MSAELEALAGAAANADAAVAAATPPDPNAPPAPVVVDYMTSAAATLETFLELVASYAPNVASLWPDSTKARVIPVMAMNMEKYQVTGLADLPCEALLILMAGPPLYKTSLAVAAQMKANAAESARASSSSSPAAGSSPVPDQAPGPAVHSQVALYK